MGNVIDAINILENVVRNADMFNMMPTQMHHVKHLDAALFHYGENRLSIIRIVCASRATSMGVMALDAPYNDIPIH